MAKKNEITNPENFVMPSDQQLQQLSASAKRVITSKAELLNIVSTLNLDKIDLAEKMIYVLGMVSLGFDLKSSRDALEVDFKDFAIWKSNERNKKQLKRCQARGDLILEERLLTFAEYDAKTAMSMKKLREGQKKEDKEVAKEKEGDILDLIQDGLEERGLNIQDAEILDIKK